VTRPTGRWMDGIAYEHRACRDGALGGSSGQLEPDRSVWVRGLDAWYRLPQRRRVVQAQEKGSISSRDDGADRMGRTIIRLGAGFALISLLTATGLA